MNTQAKTQSERFVFAKKENWYRLKDMVMKMSRSSAGSLSEDEIKNFPGLYRLACTDLSEAKMLKLSPDVIEYLNHIVGQAHKCLYGFPALKLSGIKTFLAKELPMVVRKNWQFVLISALLFLIPYFVSFFIVMSKPELAAVVVNKNLLTQMENSYKQPITDERGLSEGLFGASFYIQNNVTIAFLSFATGVLLGLGTIYFLVYNGIVLGTIIGYIVGIGYGKNIGTFVLAHSAMELTGLILSGACGLLLGYSIIKSTKFFRKDHIRLQRNRLLTLIMASVFTLFIAAFIEGLISPRPISLTVRISVALISTLALIIYFAIIPIFLRKKKLHDQ